MSDHYLVAISLAISAASYVIAGFSLFLHLKKRSMVESPGPRGPIGPPGPVGPPGPRGLPGVNLSENQERLFSECSAVLDETLQWATRTGADPATRLYALSRVKPLKDRLETYRARAARGSN